MTTRRSRMSDKVDYMSVPTHSDQQVLEAIENMIDAWDWNDLRQYIIEERMDYYCGNADSYDVDMLIEDYGEKEK